MLCHIIYNTASQLANCFMLLLDFQYSLEHTGGSHTILTHKLQVYNYRLELQLVFTMLHSVHYILLFISVTFRPHHCYGCIFMGGELFLNPAVTLRCFKDIGTLLQVINSTCNTTHYHVSVTVSVRGVVYSILQKYYNLYRCEVLKVYTTPVFLYQYSLISGGTQS